jgi:hypothetical protein
VQLHLTNIIAIQINKLADINVIFNIYMSSSDSFFNQYGKPYLVGALSGCIAVSVIQPIDTVKVVIQNRREAAGKGAAELNPITVAREVIKKDGILALYRGLDAALIRQIVYCGLRLGLYKSMEDHVKLK